MVQQVTHSSRRGANVKWVKDPKVESNLRRLGIKFEIVTGIPLSTIDREEGLRRQVRLSGRLMDDVVLKYAIAMEDEQAAFPMVILQREKRRLWPWSGNHRLGSAEMVNVQHVDAYCVEVFDPVMMDLLPRLVNTWEAVVGMSREESIINAKFMVDKHGMSVAEACKLFGVKDKAVYSYGRAEEMKSKIQNIGVPVNGFAKSTLDDMHRIKNLNALRETASLLHKHKLKGNEAKNVIEDVIKRDTESLQLEEINRWSKALIERNKPKKKSTVKLPHKEVKRERLFRLLTGLARFLESNKSVTQAQVSDPAHLQVVKTQWKTIQTGMVHLLGDNL